MKTVNVKSSRAYSVFIGKNLIDSIGDVVSENRKKCRAMVVTDETVHTLYYNKVAQSLKTCGIEPYSCVLPVGETTKCMDCYMQVIDSLIADEFTRQDVVVALGGGVIGDVAGFAASTYLRGIGLFQVPTTLLAMVDASVGGKNGIDLSSGKNRIGTIYQPESVLCDVELLKTLPESVYRDGMAEVIKCGVISDAKLFSALEDEEIHVKADEMIYRCVDVKKALIQADELDNGERHLLNFGHTYGHAIEKLSDYAIPHGQAVMIGMIMMARAAKNMKLCRENSVVRLKKLAEKFSLPTTTSYSAEDLVACVLSDKKRNADTVDIVMPLAVGQAEIIPIRVDKLMMLTQEALNEQNDET